LRTNIPEKLLKIGADIESNGPQNLTRLTVLKKWFETSGSLPSFAIFIAKRASSKRGKSKGDEAVLFDHANDLLRDVDIYNPEISLERARQLCTELSKYQSEIRKHKWTNIRIIINHDLYLIEEGLSLYSYSRDDASRGYKLAVSYCENYNPKYGNALDNNSLFKIHELVRFMFGYEATIDNDLSG